MFSMSYANKYFSRFDFVLLQIVLQEAEIMNQGKTVFTQTMSLIPKYEFDKYIKRYYGNRHAIGFKCRDQFMVMSFAVKGLPRAICSGMIQLASSFSFFNICTSEKRVGSF